jgi:hypothetical protein
MTVDQRNSGGRPDRVATALELLAGLPTRLPFERTAGDEFQGLLADEVSVVCATLALVRDGEWHIGIGAGAVTEPLPGSTREARGEAFLLAREAVDAAKRRTGHLAVRGHDPAAAAAADAVLDLLGVTVQRRSELAWQAVDLVASGMSAAKAAAQLGISRQAVGQRLAAALWQQEAAVRPVVARLLRDAAARGRADVAPA